MLPTAYCLQLWCCHVRCRLDGSSDDSWVARGVLSHHVRCDHEKHTPHREHARKEGKPEWPTEVSGSMKRKVRGIGCSNPNCISVAACKDSYRASHQGQKILNHFECQIVSCDVGCYAVVACLDHPVGLSGSYIGSIEKPTSTC